MPGNPDVALASMGVYVFNGNFLFDQLARDAADDSSSHDFGKDIIPHLVERRAAIYAHRFTDSCVRSDPGAPAYWRDVGTIDAYWEANIDLTSVVPPLDLYDPNWRIWTYQEQLPPAKFVHDEDTRRGSAINSMVSGGCILSGAEIRRSLLFSNVRAHSYSRLDGAVVLPDVIINRKARLPRRHRPRRHHPRGPHRRRGPRSRRPPLRPHPQRHHPDHPRHAAQTLSSLLSTLHARLENAGRDASSADDGLADGCGSLTTAASPGHVLAASLLRATPSSFVAILDVPAAAREP
jgi:hypothetical protein